jgi:hypothetical protein
MDHHTTLPLDPSEKQFARPGFDANLPSSPLDPSPEKIRGLYVADQASTPLDPNGERIFHLAIDGNKHSVPLDPTPEQLQRLGLGTSPKAPTRRKDRDRGQ